MDSLDSDNSPLPADLIVQILARLPVKSLFRCKSVSKFWSTIPSQDHFIRLYYETSSKNPSLLIEFLDSVKPISSLVCLDRFGAVSNLSLDFLGDRVKVRASCNGLLCCASIPNRGVYYVCNPVTREFRSLPRTRERPLTRCQPDYEATLVGLAVDPFTWKFSVVLAGFYRPFAHRPHDRLVWMVLDSETNSWSRCVLSLCDEFTHMNRNQVVFADGSLHWLTHSCSYVLVLDLRSEFWRKIGLPEAIARSGSPGRIHLLELEGSVSVVQMSGVWMNIWVLKDHVKEQWVLEERVHLRCIRGFAASAFPISQTRDVVFLATQRKVLTYGRKEKVWKEIYAVEDSFTYPLWFSAHAFKSTLFPCL